MENLENLLMSMAKGLVENKDSIKVSVDEPNEEGLITFHLDVDVQDKGRVIGKQGRIAKSIRTVMKSVAAKEGKKVNVEFVEE